jgi:isopentenyldiphosphate isomerase
MPKITIVDENDEVIGSAEKAEARRSGQIHRIVRILIQKSDGAILLQKRHPQAKDSPNKLDFSVAGHVDTGEDYLSAAHREANEELGLTNLSLVPILKFYTEKKQDNEIIRRFNQVYLARTEQEVQPNLSELGGIEWLNQAQLEQRLKEYPNDFSSSIAYYYPTMKSRLYGTSEQEVSTDQV